MLSSAECGKGQPCFSLHLAISPPLPHHLYCTQQTASIMSELGRDLNRPGPSSRARCTSDSSSSSGGTPEAPTLPHSATYRDNYTPSRPSYRLRSVTEPVAPPQVRKNGKQRGGEREWTVFGQLMEDSAQFGQRGSIRLKKRSSKRSILASEYSTHSVNTPSRPRSVLTLIDGDESVVQSPVQDRFPHEPRPEPVDSDPEEQPGDSRQSPTEHPSWRRPLRRLKGLLTLNLSVLQRNVLKCAIAYFIASLFTYITPLSHLLGSITSDGDRTPSPSGHMVATVYASQPAPILQTP